MGDVGDWWNLCRGWGHKHMQHVVFCPTDGLFESWQCARIMYRSIVVPHLEDRARRLRDEHALDVRIDVRMFESAAPAIIHAALLHHANMVALSTHGRGASRLFVGSVADKVLRAGPRAVLLFRPQQD